MTPSVTISVNGIAQEMPAMLHQGMIQAFEAQALSAAKILANLADTLARLPAKPVENDVFAMLAGDGAEDELQRQAAYLATECDTAKKAGLAACTAAALLKGYSAAAGDDMWRDTIRAATVAVAGL